MADRVGQQLGNYRLVRLLGQGGFAEVYLGEHVYLKTQVAIKVQKSTEISYEQEELERFRTEAHILSSLMHPNIVRFLEFGKEGDTPFLVMDYAPNGTLRQRHPLELQLPLTTILSYIKQITEALQYVHDEGLIHLNIKPQSMLLGQRNEILLGDFSIAVAVQNVTETWRVRGTVSYMAPEQLYGHPCAASDQYALGVVVYEWLCGKRLFDGSSDELLFKHLTMPPQPLRASVPSLSPEVEQVVMRALAKDPEGRFRSVEDFARALSSAVAPHLATPSPPLSRASPPQIQPRPIAPSAPSTYPDHTVIAPYLPQQEEPEESLRPISRASLTGALEMGQEAADQTMLNPAGLQSRELAREHLQFTAFHPRVVPVETWNTLLVYAYVESALQAVRADAAKFKDELGATPGTVDAWALSPLARGTQITIVPTCPGITFNPPSIPFTWVEDWHQAKFRFQADRRWTGLTTNGEIIIRADLIMIASVRISLRFVEQSFQPPSRDSRNTAEAPAYLFKRIFTSYSHDDTPIVLACRNTYKSLGLDVLIDIDTLRSGENWNPALMRMIENADLFQLFWSERSARSTYVGQEWRYALQHYKGEGFIRPVYWEIPLVPPPRELSHLHFDYIELPKLETSAAPNPIPLPASRKKILLKPPRLLVTTEPDKSFRATFELTGETLTLGRATDNTLCLAFSIISRHHVVLHRLNSELQEITYKIVQLQSVNPMRFNGEIVGEKVLENGDTIEIGKRGYAEYIVKLTYQAPEYGSV